MSGKISIIIPVYNMEPYLRKCLDSVMKQTYQNIEIILVDDGSSDNCGAICDEYAAQDRRIMVIHKKNKGVSSARNAGLAAATGDWIGWLDADDWVEPDMFEYLFSNAVNANADLAVCALWEELPNGAVARGCNELAVLGKEEALKLLLYDDTVNNFLWNKLWKYELFENITFPDGRSFEDVAVAYKLFLRCSKVICLPERKYHYRQHTSSILGDQNLENKINFYYATRQRMEDLSSCWGQFDQLLRASCISAAVGIWAAYCVNNSEEREKYHNLFEEVAAFSKDNRFLVLKHMNLGHMGNCIAVLTAYNRKWAFALAGFLGHIYRLKHGRSI